MWNQCRYRIACLSADIFIIFVSLSQLVLLFLFGWSVANLHNNDFTWKMPYLQGHDMVRCGVLDVCSIFGNNHITFLRPSGRGLPLCRMNCARLWEGGFYLVGSAKANAEKM